MGPKFEKTHEDNRGGIYLLTNLLEGGKEINYLEMRNGSARGGCLHSNNEYFVVLRGKIRYIHGEKEEIVSMGESRKVPAGEPHAFIALEDSIVSEWGITTEEKKTDRHDPKLRGFVERLKK